MIPLDAVLKRDRELVLGGLIVVTLLAWSYVLLGAGMGMSAFEMTRMSGASGMGGAAAEVSTTMAAMSMPADWTPTYAALMFVMWWIMMIAMMLPSASPMILLFALVNRKQAQRGAPFVPAGVFAMGYLFVWGAFSVVATGAQWLLEDAGLVSAMMTSTNHSLSAVLLIAAGLWQLTPLKHACLRHCRSPLHFLMNGFRPGRAGALRMGLEHGAYCLGCCWFLMGLLFVGGVMNLFWIGGVALYVLIEKLVPAGHWIGTAVGIALFAWGSWFLAGALWPPM